MKFEEKLMKLRKNNAWSQEEFAEKLGVTRQTVSKWELGQTTPDTDNLTKMATIFGISVNDLLNEQSESFGEDSSKITDYKSGNDELKNKNTVKIVILIVILILALLGVGVILLNNAFNKATDDLPPKTIIEMFNENSLGEIFDKVFGQMDKIDIGFGSIKKENFNSTFKTLYYGNVIGFSMPNFMDEIIKSNESNTDKLIAVKYKEVETKNANEIRNLKTRFSNNKQYEVSYEYDEQGFINKAIIEKESFTQSAITSFNSKFKTLYYGSTNGFFMNDFIDSVIKSNEENPDNVITVKYNKVETSNASELRKLKSNFKTGTTYEIIYEYDDSGLINKAIIQK